MSVAIPSLRGAIAVPEWAKNELWRKAQAAPSLDLRFADFKSLADAVTGANLVDHTRASSGTYVGSDGLIKTATTNLLLQSEDFSTTWTTQAGLTVTANQIVSPDGTSTADLVEGNGVSIGYIEQPSSPGNQFITGLSYTFSVFLKKANTSTVITLLYGATFNSGGSNAITTWNLDTGVPSFTNGATGSMTDVGNGWYRCVVTVTATATETRNQQWLRMTNNSGDVYAWGAQLEQSSTVGEYVPTTSTINSAPRFNHDPTTGESLGLLVEEQRSNLLLNSGTLSTQSVTVTAVDHALSFTGTGTVTLSGASTAGPLVGTGTGEANRVSLTFTPTAGSLTLTVSGTVTDAQLEAGSSPTSYIPTEGSQVTRAADLPSISGANFSSWYRQDEGTLFADCERQSFPSASGAGAFAQLAFMHDGTSDNTINLGYLTTSQGQFRIRTLASNEANLFSASPGLRRKLAGAYRVNDAALSGGGGAVLVDTNVALPAGLNALAVGTDNAGATALNGTIRRLTYWPTRLSDATLQAITQ